MAKIFQPSSRLQTPEDIERFEEEFRALQHDRIRLVLGLAVLTYPAFSLADYLSYPHLFSQFLWIRMAVTALCLCLYLLVRYRSPDGKCLQLVLLALYAINGSILWMIWQSQDPQTPYYAGMILSIVTFASIVPAPFHYHTIHAVIHFLAYLTVAGIMCMRAQGHGDMDTFIQSMVFWLGFVSLTLVAARNNYQLLRREILSRKRLEIAKRLLDQKAEDLAAQVIQTEESYAALVDGAADAICVIRDGSIVYGNRQAAALFGLPHDRIEGACLLEFVGEKDKKRLQLAYDALSGSDTPITLPPMPMRSDREERWIEMAIAPLTWRGEPAVLHVIRDITDRKRLEEELFQSQKLDAVGRLAGGIAHEINNMLQIISGYVQLLEVKRVIQPEGWRYLDKISEAVENATAITSQLLIYCRKEKCERVATDLNRRVVKVASLLEKTLPRMIKVECRLDPATPQILADKVQIEQVIMNLALNARDAMPNGGRLVISTKAVEIDHEMAEKMDLKPGLYGLVTVEDTGTGMDRKTARHIFEPFFTTKEVGKGTGLGLTVVYGIVKAHEGEILCTTAPGQGTRFDIYIPAADQAQSVRESSKIPDKSSEGHIDGHYRCLVVDDEPGLREMFRETLSSSGFSVVTAEDGQKALEAVDNQPPFDVIVLDLNMPGMGGLEFLQRIREMGCSTPVVVVTGYSDDLDREVISNLGIARVMKKPFLLEKLAPTLLEVMETKARKGKDR